MSPGGGSRWDDPQTITNYVAEEYATKAEHDALHESVAHDLNVHENGYLALFREHERDIRLLIYAVRALSVITALLTGYAVADLL